MSIVKMLENVLGSKVKKLSKLTDIGLDTGLSVAKGVLDASKGAIKQAAIAEIKARAGTVARDWIKSEYGIELSKTGISGAELTRLANAAIAPLVLTDVTDVRAIRKEITKFATDKIMEEYGYSSAVVMVDSIVVKARAKIGENIDNMGLMVDAFTPSTEATKVLEEYGEPKKIESKLPPKISEGNKERQATYRANHK